MKTHSPARCILTATQSMSVISLYFFYLKIMNTTGNTSTLSTTPAPPSSDWLAPSGTEDDHLTSQIGRDDRKRSGNPHRDPRPSKYGLFFFFCSCFCFVFVSVFFWMCGDGGLSPPFHSPRQTCIGITHTTLSHLFLVLTFSSRRKTVSRTTSVTRRTSNGEKEEVLKEAVRLFETQDYEEAASTAGAVLGDTGAMAQAAFVRGKALLALLILRSQDEDGQAPLAHEFEEPLSMFELATRLDPHHGDAKAEMESLLAMLDEFPKDDSPCNHDAPYDVIVVGAGASGVGIGLVLTKTFGLDAERVLLVERGDKPGESFRQWPKEMRFISPSFNSQGWTRSFDLNSVMFGSSPAFTVGSEHPSGDDYARYIEVLADVGELNVRTKTEVTAVRPQGSSGFEVDVSSLQDSRSETLKSRFVVWAGGEFQYPHCEPNASFPGAELCSHNSTVETWDAMTGEDYVVIGGYESGMDAAVNLSNRGKSCTVLSSTPHWYLTSEDPSTSLAPYTMDRVIEVRKGDTPPRLLAPLRVTCVERLLNSETEEEYVVRAQWIASEQYHESASSSDEDSDGDSGGDHDKGKGVEREVEESGMVGTELIVKTSAPPILCTGFEGSVALGVVKDLFEFGKNDDCTAGSPLLTETDESTCTPGLFLVGPQVRHGQLSFCFVYKFRQRFGIVANRIAQGLGRDTTRAVQESRDMDMFLDNFEVCEGTCGDYTC